MDFKTIKQEMAKRGISRKEMSELSGVSQGSLSGFFTGKTKPSKETLAKLAKALEEPDKKPVTFDPRYSPHLLTEAARALGQSPKSVRAWIRNGSCSWGRCIRHSTSSRTTFMVDREEFYRQYGIILKVPGKDVSDEKSRDAV